MSLVGIPLFCFFDRPSLINVALLPRIGLYLLLILEILVLVGKILKDIVFAVFFGVVGSHFVCSVLDGQIAACLNEYFAHFKVPLSGCIEEWSLLGDAIGVIGIGCVPPNLPFFSMSLWMMLSLFSLAA